MDFKNYSSTYRCEFGSKMLLQNISHYKLMDILDYRENSQKIYFLKIHIIGKNFIQMQSVVLLNGYPRALDLSNS